MLMLPSLLADRFQLTSHRETKDRAGFALMIGPAAAKPGDPSSPEGFSLEPPLPLENAPVGRTDPIDTFTRLREAVADQLGLKLESQRIAVENLIIESAERRSET
jgi:hypothetical protein